MPEALAPSVSVLLGGQDPLQRVDACLSSTSNQAENASFASSIEHVDHFTVILPHRMQGMTCPPARQIGAHRGARMHTYLPTSLGLKVSHPLRTRSICHFSHLRQPLASRSVALARGKLSRMPRTRIPCRTGAGGRNDKPRAPPSFGCPFRAF